MREFSFVLTDKAGPLSLRGQMSLSGPFKTALDQSAVFLIVGVRLPADRGRQIPAEALAPDAEAAPSRGR